ncbi:uncharacterized protein LOC121853908 isoform X1 [Homarus americanus]|uniref:Uncharacterized protein n=1 Tax=Homarus americanus TaxID=6706 RepID=A0A8J5MM47_HOMAM|nr:uncharacterized protein LOC121853908 isoform X1 [Homarus americanus]KAG7156305.1 hypothetical protein Hamer_G006031 [Homarus americanus]
MVTSTSAAFMFSCCLLVLMSLTVSPTVAQGYSSYSELSYRVPRYRSRGWAIQPRSFWSRARSITPRLFTVASEAASVLAVPALAVLALSAIWPTRRHYRIKREADGSEAPVAALTEHLMNVYYAAIESDQCMQRLACELGAASISLNPHHHNLMLQVLGSTTSNKYSGLFDKFKAGVNAEKCKKYGCSLMDNH